MTATNLFFLSVGSINASFTTFTIPTISFPICEEILSNKIINDPKIYNLYAYVLYKLNNYEHSIENWKKSLKIDSKNIDPYNGLANNFLKLEKFGEAIKNDRSLSHKAQK